MYAALRLFEASVQFVLQYLGTGLLQFIWNQNVPHLSYHPFLPANIRAPLL